MEEKEAITDNIKACEEAMQFFSNPGRREREAWVVGQFLKNIGINFENSELTPGNNPPDVIFQNAIFEIKEIDKKGRRRHDEYKQKLIGARSATQREDLIEPYEFKHITLQEIVDRIAEELRTFNYSLDFSKDTDILFYINFSCKENQNYTISDNNILKKWRSVSIITNNNLSCVFYAADSAPQFIKSRIGEIIKRPIDNTTI